jgi:hypothetical protein
VGVRGAEAGVSEAHARRGLSNAALKALLDDTIEFGKECRQGVKLCVEIVPCEERFELFSAHPDATASIPSLFFMQLMPIVLAQDLMHMIVEVAPSFFNPRRYPSIAFIIHQAKPTIELSIGIRHARQRLVVTGIFFAKAFAPVVDGTGSPLGSVRRDRPLQGTIQIQHPLRPAQGDTF